MLGPVRTFDRVAGSLVSGAWFVVVAVLLLLLATAAPTLSPRVEGLVAGSRVAGLVASEGAPVTSAVSRLLGDRLLESFVNINRLVGKSQVVIEGADRVDITMATPPDLVDRPGSARELFENINLARIEEEVATVAWSPRAGRSGGRPRSGDV